MNKTILVVSITIAIICSTIVLVGVFANNTESNKGDLIMQKETALRIGSALLREHFPEDYPDIESSLIAEEKEGIWKVYNAVNRETKSESGKIQIVKGGQLFVEFRKNDEKIMNIGIND